MTVEPAPEMREPLRTALGGVARYMATRSEGTSGKGMIRYKYLRLIHADMNAAAAYLRRKVEEFSDGKRTLRAAVRGLYADEPREDLVMALVVCDTPREEGPVTALRHGDQLYSLVVPPGNRLVVEIYKDAPASAIQG